MAKVFISHSSANHSLAKLVTNEIGRDLVCLDEYSFRAGEGISDEIKSNISSAEIFVLLLSSKVLESTWVNEEIDILTIRLFKKTIKFCPFIVDPELSRDTICDKYPWMKDWNLQECTNAKRIASIVRRKVNSTYPKGFNPSCMRSKVFVGRNRELDLLLNDSVPFDNCRAIIASGFPQIGRKRLLLEYIHRILDDKDVSFEDVVQINLHSNEGLDELCTQLKDFAYTTTYETIYQCLNQGAQSLENLCITLINELAQHNDYIFIVDDRSIVKPSGDIEKWFANILDSNKLPNKINFYIVTQYYLSKQARNEHKNIVTTQVPDMSDTDKSLLFKAYAEEKSVHYCNEYLEYFVHQPSGFPGFILDSVEDLGKCNFDIAKSYTKKNLHQYDKTIGAIVDEISSDKDTFQLLLIIANLEYATIDWLDEIMQIDVVPLVEKLLRYSALEFFGMENQYIRLHRHLEDYLLRSEQKIDKKYQKVIEEKTKDLFVNLDDEALDLCEHMYKDKMLLVKNIKNIATQKYIRPTLTLKVMVEQYRKHNYDDVINIGKYIIYETSNSAYDDIKYSVRYWLCLALCRAGKKDEVYTEADRFLQDGASNYVYNFILGYNERLHYNYNKAKAYFIKALANNREKYTQYYIKAKHELAMVYMKLDQYDKAIKLAKENYENYPNNLYNVEPYFRCLVCSKEANINVLKKLRQEMLQSQSVDSPIIVDTFDVEMQYYLYHGNHWSAINELKNILRRHPRLKKGYTLDALKRICAINDCLQVYNETRSKYIKNHEDEEELWID